MFDLQFKLEETLDGIDKVIESMSKVAERQGCKVHDLQNMDGTWAVGPLLLARAHTLSALVRLRENS